MPVLESMDELAPKSVLRHRPIGDGKEVSTTPVVPRASRPRPVEVVDDEIAEWKHKTEQTETHQAQAGKRGPTPAAPKKLPRIQAGKSALAQTHPLFYLGLGMVVMVLLWMLLSAVFGWFTRLFDDLHYGMPRTTQVDAYVGHEAGKTASHFIAENLRGRVLIIELPGGDAQHARIFVGPQISGADADRDLVTLSFVDRNGTHHPDMLVQFGSMQIWYVNEHGTFVPQ